MEGTLARSQRLLIDRVSPGGVPYQEAFEGAWLVYPSDDSRADEEGFDAGACYGVALTRKGRILLYMYHVNDLWPPQRYVFQSLQEAEESQLLPANILLEAGAALGETPGQIELDI